MKTSSITKWQFRWYRREFLVKMALAGASIPFAALVASRVSLAAEKLSEGDPTAVSLGYRHDAEQASHEQYVAGRRCDGCVFYQGENGAADGPCLVFGGKLVSAKGWCASWRAREG